MRALIFIFLALICGCTTQSYRYIGTRNENSKAGPVKTICITSSPIGCIVELNGEYIGQTPFSLTVDADVHGCWPRYFPGGDLRSFLNSFVCTAPNGSTDRRSWMAGARIPDTVLFRPFRSYPAVKPLQIEPSFGS